MEDFEREWDWFLDETAHLDIYSACRGDAYANSRLFQSNALSFLCRESGDPYRKWLRVAKLAAEGEADSTLLKTVRREIREYRRSELGLNPLSTDVRDKEDALTMLFDYALDDWPAQPESIMLTSINRDMDEFSSLFIEFFGRGKVLLAILRQSFGMDGNNQI